MSELHEAGCVGFSHADAALTDTQVLYRAMQYAATFGFTVWLRPEDACLARNGVAHDGEVAARLGLVGIPASAEAIALAPMLRLARDTGARLHVCRLSTAEGVEMVRTAKKEGLPVTCDIAATHLHLTEHDIGFFDSFCHLRPPLRTQRDRDALLAGLLDGTVDAICSDHTPVDDDAKLAPFAESEPGASGLELLLPLVLKWAVENRVALPKVLSLVGNRPADVVGIAAGGLAVGDVADVCIFEPESYWRVTPVGVRSQG